MTATDKVVKQALDRVADGGACVTCGFFDPRATDDDPKVLEKIGAALTGSGPEFVCHHRFTRYPPPAAELKAAPLCAGFAAVRAELRRRGLHESAPADVVAAVVREIRARGASYQCIPSLIVAPKVGAHLPASAMLEQARSAAPLPALQAAGEQAVIDRIRTFERDPVQPDAAHYVSIINRVTVTGALAAVKAKFSAEECCIDGQAGLRIVLSLSVPDSTTGNPLELYFSREFTLAQLNASAIRFENRLIEILRDAAVHEALEGFRIDGAPIADPHTRRLVPRISMPRPRSP